MILIQVTKQLLIQKSFVNISKFIKGKNNLQNYLLTHHFKKYEQET
jgi:hypothetical protein